MPVAPTVRTVVRTTDNILAQRRVVDMADRIALLEPEAAPLLRFTGRGDDTKALIKKESCFSPEFQWMEDQTLPGVDRINLAAGYSAAATSLVVDNGSYFRTRDIVHVPRTNEIMRLTAVTTATNTLTATRGYAGSTAAALVNNDELIILGTAMEEASSAVDPRSTLEVRVRNYTQIFRRSWLLSNTEMASKLYGGADRPYQRKKQAIEFAKSIEWAFMFGRRNEDTTTLTTPIRTTGGLRQFITQNVTNLNGQVLTEPTWDQFLATGQRYPGNNGTKVIVHSALIGRAVSSWAKGRLMITNPRSEDYGMTITTYMSPNGNVNLVRHWLLEGDEYNGWAFMLHMPALKYRYLQGEDIKLWADTQAPDYHGVRDEMIGTVGLQVEWDDNHSILRGVGGY